MLMKRAIFRNTRVVYQQQIKAATTQIDKETYTDKQKKTGRPLSPHATIYAWPIVAISSGSNRVTGVLLTGGFIGAAALELVGVNSGEILATIGQSSVGPLAKALVAFPFAYHWLGGIRHFAWDHTPEALENEAVLQSSYKLFAGTLALCGIAAIL